MTTICGHNKWREMCENLLQRDKCSLLHIGITITFDFLSSALAKQINCFCPIDRFDPLTSRHAFSPPSACTNGAAKHKLIACQISESMWSVRGSKFSRIVPANRKISCGTRATRDRSVSSGMDDISHESMLIRPVDNGTVRSSADTSDVFPAPVRPTMPIRSHDDDWNSTFFSAGCR